MKNFNFKIRSAGTSPAEQLGQIRREVPKEGKLFLSQQAGEYYCYGQGMAYKTNEKLEIIEQHPCPFLEDYMRTTPQFSCAIQCNDKTYGIARGYLLQFDKFQVNTITQLPSESFEKLKMFSINNELFMQDSSGQTLQFKYPKTFVQVSFPSTINCDCLHISYKDLVVVVNPAQNQLSIIYKAEEIPLKFEQQAIDVLMPFYIMSHTDKTNTFIDLTYMYQNLIKTDKIDITLIKMCTNCRRNKDIEWHKALSFLTNVRGIWVPANDVLRNFSELDDKFVERLVSILDYKKVADVKDTIQQQPLAKADLLPVGQVQNQPALPGQLPVVNEQLLQQFLQFVGQQNQVQKQQQQIQEPIQQLVIKQQEQIHSLQVEVDKLKQNQKFYQMMFQTVIEKMGSHKWQEFMGYVVAELAKK